MIKIFLSTLLIIFLNTSLLANETNCKKFDLKCKTKKFIDDTKSFQSKGLDESKEQINYRYEIQKKLGKGAFGVVVRCFDHKHKEVVALKILKNWKKLHK